MNLVRGQHVDSRGDILRALLLARRGGDFQIHQLFHAGMHEVWGRWFHSSLGERIGRRPSRDDRERQEADEVLHDVPYAAMTFSRRNTAFTRVSRMSGSNGLTM